MSCTLTRSPPAIQILAADAAGATALTETLGTGDTLLSKINTELQVPSHPHPAHVHPCGRNTTKHASVIAMLACHHVTHHALGLHGIM